MPKTADQASLGQDRPKLTNRGEITRQRIVAAANELMFGQGVAATTLEEVRAVSGTSNSQLYHYFVDKSDLVQAAIGLQVDRFLETQRSTAELLDSWESLRAWRDLMVALQQGRECRGGCAVGSLASELADKDEPGRTALVDAFDQWKRYLADGLAAMREDGDLVEQADPDALATALMAALEGGLILSQTMRSVRPLEISLDAALGYLETFRRA
ncbi:TetR family transcriptional regulator C-terminal domain-containing protein [Streptomyces sp. NPDC057137]|uniref:TetR/AcrR family transcriptional regulator n=1 Tax=Streptomyces sp. NPDC057137 TaxID=3346030 RepID=UPI003633FDCA